MNDSDLDRFGSRMSAVCLSARAWRTILYAMLVLISVASIEAEDDLAALEEAAVQSAVRRAVGMRAILDDGHACVSADLHQRVHVADVPVDVDDADHLRARRDALLDVSGVDTQRVGFDVHKDRYGVDSLVFQ